MSMKTTPPERDDGPQRAEPTDESEDLLRDDAACREAFRRGERGAMARVYESYLPLVEAICVHGFGTFRGFYDPLDRDDAVQAVFTAAFDERTRLGYDGLGPYRSYLRGIAHNVIRDMLTRRTRFARRPERLDPPSGDVEAELIDAETCALLRHFRTQQVEGREREVLERYFCEGWSEERLAAHLKITRYRARKIIAKLHKRMSRYLRDHGIDDD